VAQLSLEEMLEKQDEATRKFKLPNDSPSTLKAVLMAA